MDKRPQRAPPIGACLASLLGRWNWPVAWIHHGPAVDGIRPVTHLRGWIDHCRMQLLRRDGANGRDPDSVRNPKQRLADTPFELMTNRDADTGEFIDHLPMSRPWPPPRWSWSHRWVWWTAPSLGLSRDDRRRSRTSGDPRNPDSGHGVLAGMIVDRAGRPLWMGRNQRLAVAVRDGGCFECNAPCTVANSAHARMALRQRPHRHLQLGRHLPQTPQVARNGEPRSRTHPQRLRSPIQKRPRTLT